jgi:hypothetical protein
MHDNGKQRGTMEHSTPIIELTPEQRHELKVAWKEQHDLYALVALQSDNANRKRAEQLKQLQDVSGDVRMVKEAIKEGHKKQVSVLRGLWNAVWHGFGVIKAEGDKVMKE